MGEYTDFIYCFAFSVVYAGFCAAVALGIIYIIKKLLK